ncbi:MarR family winged helix-turn-helix transcriptional regulator [Marinibaculum pumilum]|uniref:MarR family winged helix-turn-helix transcriptional regulator n=1 Tax=Marinibaculum pumilum TaxID=1766165 RepID=A0ABV7KYT0_9PROT
MDYLSDDLRIADFLSVRISRLARSVDRMTRRILAHEFQISLIQWRCLALLSERGPMTGQAMSEINDNDNSQTSRALRGLHERGFVDWESGSQRRAAGTAHVTDEGRAFFHAIEQRMRARHRWLLEALEPEEWAGFYDQIRRLSRHVRSGWPDAPHAQDGAAEARNTAKPRKEAAATKHSGSRKQGRK